MNGRIEREGLCFSDDSHLADLFREAERKRLRVNWWAVVAFVMVVVVATLFWVQVARTF
jgi:hypothetical protein